MKITHFITRVLVSFLFITMSCGPSFSKDYDREFSYHLQRAIEALRENKVNEATEFFKKELEDHPKNGYAYYGLGCIHKDQKDYARALTAFDKALSYVPKKDKQFLSYILTDLSDIHLQLEDRERALESISKAIECCPKEEKLYKKRGELYFLLSDFQHADQDYNKMISLNPGSVMGYMGLGRNAMEQKEYRRGEELFSYVIKLAADYSSGYSFRSDCYFQQKKMLAAMNDAIIALRIDYDEKAFYLVEEIGKSMPSLAISKLEIEAKKNPSDNFWDFCLGNLYQVNREFDKAIDAFKRSYKIAADPILSYRLSCCNAELGNWDEALNFIDLSLEQDSLDQIYQLSKVDILYQLGRSEESIQYLNNYISHWPEEFFGYYKRGFIHDNLGQIDEAIDDYTLSIIQNPEYAYAYLGRGDMYKLKGMPDQSVLDYERVLVLDSIPQDNSCAQFALHELGRTDEAKLFMKRILEKNPDLPGNYYDAACLYARMKDYDSSFFYLKTAFEKGYRSLHHVMNDDDLAPIRKRKDFVNLVDSLTQRNRVQEEEIKMTAIEERTTKIPFQKTDGVTKVKCSINKLPLYFVFDTGAATISISDVEANFMMKNGYLSQKDILGTQNFVNADGGIAEGTMINLRNVEFGDVKLNNIQASIVKNQKAPLLLGQSVLKRCGKIEIDNEAQVLIVTTKKIKEK